MNIPEAVNHMTPHRCIDTCFNFLDKNPWWIELPQSSHIVLFDNIFGADNIYKNSVFAKNQYSLFDLYILVQYLTIQHIWGTLSRWVLLPILCFAQRKRRQFFWESVHPQQPLSSTPKWSWAHSHTHWFLSLIDYCLRRRLEVYISVEVWFR